MKRWLFLAYGIAGHVTFLATYAYMAGFVGNLFVPKSIDAPAGGYTAEAVAINLLLVAIFAVQHSVMARPAFKRLWTRLVPQPIERATYVWFANAATILLMWQWQPIDALVWDAEQPFVRGMLWSLFAAGWLAVPLVSLLINHFDLFGTRQVWLFWRNKPYTNLPFRTPAAYAHVRHPLYLGWGLLFWAIPTMTVGHLLFAGSLTAYMMLAAIVEERDLVNHFGQTYRDYRRRVPMFVPSLTVAATVFQTSRESEPLALLMESEASEIASDRLGCADVPLTHGIGDA
jgi:methanethiol S-methyltransferase